MDHHEPSAGSQLTRRSFLAAATTVLVTADSALAQPSGPPPGPRVKGPRVWLDMDQAELDAAYVRAEPAADHSALRHQQRGRTRTPGRPAAPCLRCHPIEGLDIYTTKRPNAPINIFIHGGAWRVGLAKEYAFAAELFVHAGAHLVLPDHVWVQDAGGNLIPLAEQVRRAVGWVYRNAHSFGGNPNRIYVSGHSSGAHLAGVVLTTDWPKDFNLPADIIKGGLCCSGMFDLKPVRLSARSRYVKFTDETEQALSSQRQLDKLHAPVIVAYGTLETPEFQRQSRDFAAAVKAAGKRVELLVGEGSKSWRRLPVPYGLLGRAVLQQMNLPDA